MITLNADGQFERAGKILMLTPTGALCWLAWCMNHPLLNGRVCLKYELEHFANVCLKYELEHFANFSTEHEGKTYNNLDYFKEVA